MEEAKKEHKVGFFTRVKAEFKKIIWPNKETLAKSSVAVIVAAVIVGALIALLDMVLKTGIGFIV